MEENKSNEIRASNLQLDTASNKKAFNESDKLQKAKRKTEILDLLNLISINDTSDKGLYNKVKDLFLDEVPELNILGLDWSMGIVKHIKDHFKLSDDVLKPIEEQAEKTISKLLQNGNEVNALILLRMFDLDDKRLHSEFQQSFIDKIPELKEKEKHDFNYLGIINAINYEFRDNNILAVDSQEIKRNEILDNPNVLRTLSEMLEDPTIKNLDKFKEEMKQNIPDLTGPTLNWSVNIVNHIKNRFGLNDAGLKFIEEEAEKSISKLLQNDTSSSDNIISALTIARMFDLDDKRLHSEFQQSFIDKIPELKEKKFNGVVDMIDNEFNLNLGGKKNTPEDIKFSNSLEEMKSILKNAKIALENTITNEGGNINFGSSSSGAFATNSKYDVSSNEDEKLANVKIKNIEQGIRLITPAHNKNFDEEEEKRLTALGKLKKLAITFIDAELEFIDTIVGG